MSEKMTCPVCNAHTSGVFGAVMNDAPCPYCGTPAATILDVERLREQRADVQLKARVEELMLELGRVTAERDRLAAIVERVSGALEE